MDFSPQDRFHDEFIDPLSREWPIRDRSVSTAHPDRKFFHKAEMMQKERLIPLIVACAWFMENMDYWNSSSF